MSHLFGQRYTYRLIMTFDFDSKGSRRITDQDFISVISNLKPDELSSFVVRAPEWLSETTCRFRIHYNSSAGPLISREFVREITKNIPNVKNVEVEQEVEEKDGTYTNLAPYVEICEAEGCNTKVNNTWSIYNEDNTLEKRYFLCDEHIKIAQNRRGFSLKERKQ